MTSTVTRCHRIKNFKEFFNFTHTWLPCGQQSLVVTELRISKNFLTSPTLDYDSQDDFNTHSFSQETSKKTDSKKQSTKESVIQVIPDLDEEVLCTDCAMIGVSMATAITGAKIKGAPLYEHLAFLSGKKVFFCLQYLSFLWSVIPKKLTILLFWAHLKPVKADSFLETPPLRQEGAAAGNIPAFVSSHKVCYYGTRKKMNLVSTVRKKKIATFYPGANLIQAQTG